MSSTTAAMRTYNNVWPLLLGIGVLMIGSGLQTTLLGLRAHAEAFPIEMTGMVMAMYYVGFLLGCQFIPRMLGDVGHVRVFAALASIASVTILIHGVFINPWIWALIRLTTGFSFCGLFMVAESWLNNMTNRRIRGKIFGSYVSVVYGGMLSGQLLIGLAEVSKIDLFILVSILISLALAPITLCSKPMPAYAKPEKLPFRTLIARSPLAMTGVFAAGLCSGTMLGLLPVYLRELGQSQSEVSLAMALYIFGNASFPLVIGWFSDRISRRKIIIALSALGSAVALTMLLYSVKLPLLLVLGGLITTLYSMSVSYMHDHIGKAQIISATTSMMFLNSVGSALGPLLGGFMLAHIGSASFFAQICIILTVTLLVGIYRALFGNVVDVGAQKRFVNIPAGGIYTAPSLMRPVREDVH